MERRQFIRASAIGSSCLLAGTILSSKANELKMEPDFKCKITVLKRSLNSDWNMQFKKEEGVKCEIFSDNQEFVLESPWTPPEGFCHWAWADIRTYIHLVWEGKFENFVTCCTDGFRPVFFKIERISA